MNLNVVTVAIGTYLYDPVVVAGVEESTNRVEAVIAHPGAIRHDWSSHATRDGVSQRLRDLFDAADESNILYWTGHGQFSDEDGYLVALTDSRFPLRDIDTITDVNWARVFARYLKKRRTLEQDSWVLVILDTCGSKEGVAAIWSEMTRRLEGDVTNFALVATTARGAAVSGRFAKAFERILTTGWTGNDQVRPIRVILERLEEDKFEVWHKFGWAPALSALPGSVMLDATLDVYAEVGAALATSPAEFRHLFAARAQGGELGEFAGEFYGRGVERRFIADWLAADEAGVLAVTGEPGVGKSALLGMVAAESDPRVVAVLNQVGGDMGGDGPDWGAFDRVVHLQDMTVDDVRVVIAGAFGSAGGSDRGAGDRSRGLRAAMLFDALDESRDPVGVAAFLRELAATGCRVVVGTRRFADQAHVGEHSGVDLVAMLVSAAGETLELRNEPGAVKAYVSSRLSRSLPTDAETVSKISVISAEVAATGNSFLFARSFVHELLAEPAHVSSPLMLRLMVVSGTSGLFSMAADRLKRDNPAAEALLHALAYAKGAGYPRHGGVWRAAAGAFTDDVVTEGDVEIVLKAAAPYIMHSSENGEGVFRLGHRAFVDAYRASDLAGDGL